MYMKFDDIIMISQIFVINLQPKMVSNTEMWLAHITLPRCNTWMK